MPHVVVQFVASGDRQVNIHGVVRLIVAQFAFTVDAIAEGIGLHFNLVGVGTVAAHNNYEKQHNGYEKLFHDI